MSKSLIEKVRDYFEYSAEYFQKSRDQAREIIAFNHNKHYTIEQLNVLANRKQPAETFNVIKSYKRVVGGYLASTISNINVKPVGMEDVNIAMLGQDIIQYTLRVSKFKRVRVKLIDDLLLTGFCAYEIRAEETGQTDQFGTKDMQIKINYLPWDEVLVDPRSREEDYSDAKYISKFRWLSQNDVEKHWPGKADELNRLFTIAEIEQPQKSTSKYKMTENYLVVTTYLKDENDKIHEVIWCGDVILETHELSDLTQFPIRPIYLERDDDGFYGIFREVLESQKAINQALIQIQLMVNVNKVYVNKTAVESLSEFRKAFNRVNSIIEVKDINGIKVDNLHADVLAQYQIIDRSLERIKRILNLNDSFLGMMGSSASGRQVKLQQNMTASALTYITSNIEYMYECMGEDILEFSKLYYKAYKVLRISDQRNGDRFIELNKPFMMPKEDGTGQEIAIKEIEYDKDGNAKIVPWIERETQIEFLNYDIEITTANYNETDDLEKVQLDAIIQGIPGQFLMNADPASFGRVVALSMRAMKTRNSEYIADVFEQVANKLAPAPTMDPRSVANGEPAEAVGPSAIMSALGMTNDGAKEGYNRPKE